MPSHITITKLGSEVAHVADSAGGWMQASSQRTNLEIPTVSHQQCAQMLTNARSSSNCKRVMPRRSVGIHRGLRFLNFEHSARFTRSLLCRAFRTHKPQPPTAAQAPVGQRRCSPSGTVSSQLLPYLFTGSFQHTLTPSLRKHIATGLWGSPVPLS